MNTETENTTITKKLIVAQKEMASKVKSIFKWFNDNQVIKLADKRNEFVKIAYDYLQVLKNEDSNTDKHSLTKITKVIFDAVGLKSNEYNSKYFRKFANTCVQGSLLLHWQDIKKKSNDGNAQVLTGIAFAKKETFTWQKFEGQTFTENGKKKARAVQHNIKVGMLVIPFNVLQPTIIVKNERVINNDNTLITLDGEGIKRLYARFKDITQQDIDDETSINESVNNPELVDFINAINKCSSLYKQSTMDIDFVADCYVNSEWQKAHTELNTQMNNFEIARKKDNEKLAPTQSENRLLQGKTRLPLHEAFKREKIAK